MQMAGLINRPDWALTWPRVDGKHRRRGALLAVVAVPASAFPVRRALRVDPTDTLRDQ